MTEIRTNIVKFHDQFTVTKTETKNVLVTLERAGFVTTVRREQLRNQSGAYVSTSAILESATLLGRAQTERQHNQKCIKLKAFLLIEFNSKWALLPWK